MTDYFALLGQPRLPWLDAEILKSKFLELSSSLHPDRIHAAHEMEKQAAHHQYSELNTAYSVIREPKDRVLHLLELELESSPRDIQRIPPGTMELFIEVGQICRDVDVFLGERAKATSPMVKVQFFERALFWTERLKTLKEVLEKKKLELFSELKTLNSFFESATSTCGTERRAKLPLARLEEIYRVLGYINRWSAQIQDRFIQLAF